MRYMGSKARHAKHIVPLSMTGHDPSRPYIEPFVGGGNMICHVPADNRQGSDVAEWAIALLDALSKGWEPPEILSETEYHQIKEDPYGYDSALVGFAAYCCSYAGKFWGGYARGNCAKGQPRNFAAEQARHLRKQRSGLLGVRFECLSYLDRDYPSGSTVYMDPPYQSTTSYKGGFDHREFWVFCDDLSKSCRVFVSEYSAPDGWDCVWERPVTNSLTKNTGGKTGVERLYTK